MSLGCLGSGAREREGTDRSSDVESAFVTPSIAVAVKEAYDGYLAGFHTHRAGAVRPFVNVPLVIVAGGEVSLIATPEDLEAMYAGILRTLAEVEYSHTVMASQEVSVLDETTALMRVSGTRYDVEGRALERIAAVYTFVFRDNAWKITVMMPFAASDDQDDGGA
jgi:hypothetical protein